MASRLPTGRYRGGEALGCGEKAPQTIARAPHPALRRAASNTSSLPTMAPLWVCAASLPAGFLPRLQNDHRFGIGGRTQCTHKASRTGDAFQVHDDAMGLPVICQEIQNLGNIYRGIGTQRYDRSKIPPHCCWPSQEWRMSARRIGIPAPAIRAWPVAPPHSHLSCRCGRCKPRQLGPRRCTPSRLAIFFNSAALCRHQCRWISPAPRGRPCDQPPPVQRSLPPGPKR